MFKVPESGEIEHVADFSNAFRSAWHVWSEMAEAYFHENASRMMLEKSMQLVWDLWKCEDVPLDYRIVMAFTFDNVMVRRKNFVRLAEAMEAFAKRFGPGTLWEQAQMLRQLASDETVYAVCWNQTSVNADTWWIRDQSLSDDEDEQYRMYDISKDKGHWFLFDELAEA
ncbi:MAG: hypothetical protein AMS14_07180 [Planctomycetes bacterium DG_20]|nr:MAG: hypothetical protein AMS14_07180 [Planctomycetes bacterium DG_20]